MNTHLAASFPGKSSGGMYSIESSESIWISPSLCSFLFSKFPDDFFLSPVMLLLFRDSDNLFLAFWSQLFAISNKHSPVTDWSPLTLWPPSTQWMPLTVWSLLTFFPPVTWPPLRGVDVRYATPCCDIGQFRIGKKMSRWHILQNRTNYFNHLVKWKD